MTIGKYVLCIEALWNKCAEKPDSDYQAFCVKLLAKTHIKLEEINNLDPKFVLNAMASRAHIQSPHSKVQILPYASRKGAYKVVESTENESLYSCVAIFNGSD